MAINVVVAVTDREWHYQLKLQPELSEVNFWKPSEMGFHSLRPGEPFLFKTKYPHNKIVGGGIFAYSLILPISRAWDAFGLSNGAKDFLEMRRRIAGYRSAATDAATDFKIGCRIITDPVFFDESDYFDPPARWHKNNPGHEAYSTDSSEGYALWSAYQDRRRRHSAPMVAETSPAYGTPQIVTPRLGQGGFRILVQETYARKCAVTGERTLPALEAAHIRPYSDGGRHEVSNGLLLRRDLHRLFDTGYVTVNPSLRLEVSQSIREEFTNGRHYYAMHGSRIYIPDRREERPSLETLDWHNTNIYRG
ncbi:MAG: HNH endonuclease [Chloroflexi bacterium]|nr:HNH endonuclease [Chloroflexota bacterium]